jgi:Tol biopolymer transport system component
VKALAGALLMTALVTVDQHDQSATMFGSQSAAVSADGRYIAFASYAPLLAADTDYASDVYVLDRLRQQLTFESGGLGPTINCVHPGISGDGRYIAYEADGAIQWKDRRTGQVVTAARGRQPSMAQDGSTVAFTAGRDIYSIDLRTRETRRASLDAAVGGDSSVASISPSPSADGRYVAFAARPISARPGTPASEIFVRDLLANDTRRIGPGWTPSMSADGRYVAFIARVAHLDQVFVADLRSGTTTLVTRSAAKKPANGSSANPRLSADGRFVVFQSEAGDLVTQDDVNLLWDVFLYDRETEGMVRLSGDLDAEWMEPSIGPAIDGSGKVIAFSSRHPTGRGDARNDFDLYVATITEDHQIKK